MSSTAAWFATAEEAGAEEGLPVGEVSRRTGLRPQTLLYAIARRARLRESAPMYHLVRPRYRHGMEPRWSEEQVQGYHQALRERNELAAQHDGLPAYESVQDARRDGMLSLRGISRASGVGLTTIHRYSQHEDWPSLAAVLWPGSLSPRSLYRWSEVRTYLLVRRPGLQLPKKPR